MKERERASILFARKSGNRRRAAATAAARKGDAVRYVFLQIFHLHEARGPQDSTSDVDVESVVFYGVARVSFFFLLWGRDAAAASFFW